jgi:hypothetical protein
MNNINFPEVRYPSDFRLLLFRYILPGLLFLAISIFYGFAFIEDFAGRLIRIGSAIGWIMAVVVTIGLFCIGLLLRLIPVEKVISYLSNRFFGKEKPFDILNNYIKDECDIILEAFQIAIPDDVKKDNNEKYEKELWLYILHDRMNSKVVPFLESAYMFWFNFALIALIFLILIPITYSLPSYWILTPLSPGFIILMLIFLILSIIKGVETLDLYISVARIFLETKIHIKPKKL